MFRVDDTRFIRWTREAGPRLKKGLFNAPIDAGLLIKETTTPYVPLDRGYLEDAYEQRIYTLLDQVILDFGYHVKNNPYSRGFDYSWIQHEKPLKHPKRGTWKYLDKGIIHSQNTVFDIIETEFYQAIQ